MDNYQVITIDQQPTTYQWKFPTLYKKNKIGTYNYWMIGFDAYTSKIITITGMVTKSDGNPGKARISNLTVKTNNSGRDIMQQALLQAKAKYKHKYKSEDYRMNDEEESNYFLEQLANKYIVPNIYDYSTGQYSVSNIAEEQLIRGVSCQAKVDGIRAMAWRSKDVNSYVTLTSRRRNEFKHPMHIRHELYYFFHYLDEAIKNEWYAGATNIPDFGIDGELYNNDISFEDICSIVKTDNQAHTDINKIKYWIFDIMIKDIPTDYRLDMLKRVYDKFTKTIYYKGNILVLTSTTVHSYQEIRNLFIGYTSQGFEGLMIRKLAGADIRLLSIDKLKQTYYNSGRSKNRSDNLLKYKNFIDEEVTVIDIVSGEGKEENLANMIVKDKRGNTFNVHPKESFEKRKTWLEYKHIYIGKQYTIKYNELTEKGIPRFAVGIAFRDYE